MQVVSKSLDHYFFFGHAYVYNYDNYKALTKSKPVIKEKNITLTSSYLVWDKSNLDMKYQIITNYESPPDLKQFAAFKGIPADRVAWADLDHLDDLKRDFPEMKPEHIGLHSLLTNKSIHTVLDPHGLNMTDDDKADKFLGFLASDRMATIYFDLE